ncbi:MAG: ATP synthase F1 subunit epsilon [Deltaproteobacteria bacterium CG_4_8_14_3_um_filter_51_11]|nr:MAG: ATP synthase F1 subunit epsilon [Desulfobacteraceae bacterium CG2_30_51_40]PIP45458.1 MAG: ATP synthase F1 subunit epsilon [Deltaproteobacteria bacterium CG23_combo_of_CG06-09_8_20_14_all_51_20]PIX18086.1 MAG: ATP synthase F1 subunit epsilon [Deltaproteobacteria bacterium CG_4_8_14_3_um_filter_51_11]PIY24936.1 MAG: ATP synthase F1 subunit epsilon [Deltaproteobacteria bacterium CG_4_10_14_3_um_filter_51_14]PJB33917.1 MAG: ATP synthase F1 subunit epsilon [Deltaproteobacteria bacterium CG_
MANLHLEVVTPERVVVSEDVLGVVAPGSMGEFGILPGHVPFLTSLVPGELRYNSGSRSERLAVSSGFAEVSNNRVSVLVDAAEKAQEIDIERAKKALERARERLAMERGKQDVDHLRAEISLKRAIARIKVVQKSI